MKKQLAIISLVSLCFACTKDTGVSPASSSVTISKGAITKSAVTTPGDGSSGGTGTGGGSGTGTTTQPSTSKSYTDLMLQPRQPGQTYDTYTCTWNGVYMMVTGSPQWNMVTWPCLANGVPTVYSDVSVNVPLYQSGGADMANIPQITSISNSTGQTVFTLQVIYITLTSNTNGTTTYGNYKVVNYQGEMIRVTTGSHWAIASIGYPKPAANAGCTVPTNPPGDI